MSMMDMPPVTHAALTELRDAFKNPGTMQDPPSDRERFCAMLYTHPLIRADVTVVLCGEDAAPRIAMSFEIWKSVGAHGILLSGGLERPPRLTGAESARRDLLGKGVAPGRIVLEAASQHTHEQAVNVLALAAEKGWTRLQLVASPYHAPRAFLTFLAELQRRGETDTVRLIPACPAVRWSVAPDGGETSRLGLLEGEFAKVEEYGAAGHVASYADGLAYLETWESR